MKKIYLSLMLCLSFGYTSWAQISSEMENDFQEILDAVINDNGYIGVSASVKVGDTQWAGVSGISATNEDLTNNSTFGMGSITKTITSACILQMMEQGALQLSDPLHFYLDTYPNIDSTITIKQLLNHTSGIFNYTDHPDFGNIFMNPAQYYTQEDVLAAFVAEPSFVIGTKQEYSNTNYLLLGMIIETIAKQSFQDEIRARFNPNDEYPSFDMPPYDMPTESMANLWLDPTGTGNPPQDMEGLGFSLNSFFTAAHSAGAYASTTTDLARWGYDLYAGNILAEASMDSLFAVHPFGLFGVIDYGLGVFSAPFSCNQTGWGHNGNIIYTAACYYIPELDLSVAVMTNDGGQLPDVGGVDGIANELACLYQTTGTNQAQLLDDSFDISPNPSSDNFVIAYEIETAAAVSLTVHNELGAVVATYDLGKQLVGQQQFVLENDWPAGFYIVKMNIGEQFLSKKIIKF